MNPYILTKSGTWPFEKYTISLNESVIDFRDEKLAVEFMFSPVFVEDNNYTEFYHSKFNYNTSLLGLSSNYNFITSDFGDVNLPLKNNLNLTWTPSSFRGGNYGNIFSGILLRDRKFKYYGIITYPSKLFLYPTQVNALNEYSYDVPDTFSTLTAIDSNDINNIYSLISQNSAAININTIDSPLISSINYFLTSFNNYETTNFIEWTATTSGFNKNSFVSYSSSKRDELNDSNVNVSISSFVYITSSNFIKNFIDINSYNLNLNDILSSNTYYRSNTFFSNITSIEYKTFIKQITSSNYFIQTSSVLLEYDSFQLIDNLPASAIKTGNSNEISTIPKNILSLKSSSINNIVYNLSGNITKCLNKIINFTEIYNPVDYSINLEKPGAKIRPDTCRLCYDIKFVDYTNGQINEFGDEYDDFDIKPDRSIGGSSIIKQNNNILTFQMFQSAIRPELPLENMENCVLSSVLNLDNSNFKYLNTWTPDLFSFESKKTSISGVPGKYLGLRYIAELPYISENESIQSSIFSVSSFPSLSINSPISISNHNDTLNWNLKYPPYYYIFNASYNTTNSLINYTNKNSLMFYLSSTVLSNTSSITSDDPYDNTCVVDLYTSVYSDYDIVELPLKQYGINDYIKYELIGNNRSDFDLSKLKAYIIDIPNLSKLNEVNILTEYSMVSSPYIPAINGSFLRLVYNLGEGGGIFTLKPTLSTKVGELESYWATSFPVAFDTEIKNYIKPFPIKTIFSDITSVRLSIEELTSVSSINLKDTEICWIFQELSGFEVKNLTPNSNITIPVIESGVFYNFDDVNLIEIVGLFETPYNITLSSFYYESKTTKTINPDLFNLYHEKSILIKRNDIDLKNEYKLLKFDCKVPLYNKIFDVNPTSTVMWNWDYTTNQSAVSAYICPSDYSVSSLDVFLNDINLNVIKYDENTVLEGGVLSSIFILIEAEKTITEDEYPFNIRSEVRDAGNVFISELNTEIKTHPSSDVFSSDFKINYTNFLSYDLINTDSKINSVTRPPNGTNVFYIEALKLNSLQSSISSMKWVINNTVTPLSSKSLPYNYSETINLTKDVSGFFDADLIKDFNLYKTILKNYTNLEIVNPLSTTNILTSSEDSFSYFGETKTNSDIIDGEEVFSTYDLYSLNLYTSSNTFVLSDNQSVINSFSSNNIVGKNNIIDTKTYLNQTSSFEYSIYEQNIEKEAYSEYEVSLFLENVSIVNWSGLYNFKQTAKIIIPAEIEFLTTPDIYLIPRFTWIPDWKQKNKTKRSVFKFICDGNTRTFNITGTNSLTNNSDIQVYLNNSLIYPNILFLDTPNFSFISNGITKTFNISGLGTINDPTYINVYSNNILLTPVIQYTLSSNLVTLQNAVSSGSKIDIYIPNGYELSDNIVTLATFPVSGSLLDIYGLPNELYYNNSLTNKFISILDDFNKTDVHLLTGKTYGNTLSGNFYNIILQGLQDTDILPDDPIQIVFGIKDENDNTTILDDQIIDDPSQYILSHNEIYISGINIPTTQEIYNTDGMPVCLTAFNRFFPIESSVSYLGLDELSSSELKLFYYPITACTHKREYNENGIVTGNIISFNPKLDEYEPFRFLFYPEVNDLDLDSKRIIKVKQIIETIPTNSPNILEYDKSNVVYTLSSDFWSVSSTFPAISNGYVELFKINTGDPAIPLTVSDFGVSNLVLTASAFLASKITDYTFSKYTSSEYSEERNLWNTSYQTVIGNENYPTVSLLAKSKNTYSIFDEISSV